MRHNILYSLTLVLILTSVLTACGDASSRGLWQEYTSRISNVFDTDIPPAESDFFVFSLPAKNQRQHVLSPPNISLLQFLQLHQCQINSLIAQRNGPLGKVMLPSQTLIYVSQFIPQALDCLAQDDINATNKQALKQAIKYYQENKHAYLFNALFHDEFQDLFHASSLWPMGANFNASGIPGLDYWNTLLHNVNQANWPESPLEAKTLETGLQQLGNSQLMGHWLQEIHLASKYLESLSLAMNAHKGLCLRQQTSIKKTALVNVFRLWFTDQVQHWVSQLDRFGQRAQQQLKPLMSESPAMLDAYNTLFVHAESPWKAFQQHWRTHVKAWQRHLNQCQSMPGQRAP